MSACVSLMWSNICNTFGNILFLSFTLTNGFNSYLDQEEGHSICLQGPGKLHILHFCLNLCHLSTVFMVLDKRQQLYLHLFRLIIMYVMCCITLSMCFIFCHFMPQQRTNYYNSHGPPTVSNTWFSLNATFEQRNVHTWNIFFSDPLCLMYSLGRNSFRLRRQITFLHGYPFGL